MIVTVGGNEAILITMLGLLNPGDEVLVVDPCWLNYFTVFKWQEQFRSLFRRKKNSSLYPILMISGHAYASDTHDRH